jgi:hypothetical protein
LGIAAIAAFELELVVFLIEMAAYGVTSPAELPLPKVLGHYIIVYLIWGLVAVVTHMTAKRRLRFDLFALKGPIKARSLLLILLMCALHILYATYSWDWQFKPLAEYNNFVSIFGDQGWIVAVFQLLYYFIECLLLTVIIAFGQEFGERRFGKKKVPWGGILLALTWGLSHFITQFTLEAAISCSVIAVYFGVSYLLLKKNAVYSWLLFFVAYTL